MHPALSGYESRLHSDIDSGKLGCCELKGLSDFRVSRGSWGSGDETFAYSDDSADSFGR